MKKPKSIPEPKWLRLRQAAQTCGLSEAMFRKLWSQRQGPKFARIGRAIVIKSTDLEAWLDSQATEGGAI